jgi:hypothetical protein
VIEAALDLLLAQQERRRVTVPAKVKRAVRDRDGEKCQWPLDSGGVCGATARLEIDHVVPRARGGPSTVENCRILCRTHNQLAARQVYGDDWMDRFTHRECADVPIAREPAVAWGCGARRPRSASTSSWRYSSPSPAAATSQAGPPTSRMSTQRIP